MKTPYELALDYGKDLKCIGCGRALTDGDSVRQIKWTMDKGYNLPSRCSRCASHHKYARPQ